MITGVIEWKQLAEANKYGKCTIKVDGVYYRSKFNFPGEVGDTVEFDNLGGKLVNKLKVVARGGAPTDTAPPEGSPAAPAGQAAPAYQAQAGFPVPSTAKDRSIIRQNSLMHATNLVVARPDYIEGLAAEEAAEEIVSIARIFEAYSTGHADAKAAKVALEG